VPSLLLQPLIENAVKYAVSPSERGGTIRVEGRTRGSMLELAVADDGPGLTSGSAGSTAVRAGRGVGLRNTRERLAVLYDDRHRFATIDNKPGAAHRTRACRSNWRLHEHSATTQTANIAGRRRGLVATRAWNCGCASPTTS
jgi:hypothetical protein